MSFSTFVTVELLTSIPLALIFFYYLTRNPFFAYSTQLLYALLSVQISVILIDQYNVYLIEPGIMSSNIGASARIVFYNYLSVASLILFSYLIQKRKHLIPRQLKPAPPSTERMVLVILSIISFLQFINLLTSQGTPLFNESVTRHNYWEQYSAFPILSTAFGKLMIFYPFLLAPVIMNSEIRSHKLTGIALILFYVSYLIITGQKFHGLLLPLIVFFASSYSIHYASGAKFPWAKLMVAGISCIIGALFIGYIDISGRGLSANTGGAVAGFLYRIFVVQGAIYWTADLHTSNGTTLPISELFRGGKASIELLLDPNLIKKYDQSNINLASAMPAIGILCLGYVGTILPLVMYSAIYVAISVACYRDTVNGNLYSLFISSYLWLWIASAWSRGSFETITSLKFFGFLTIYAAIKSGMLRYPNSSK